ncbi:MAG: ABC transporter ATP-binding protein [Anaerolineales bacterium]|jgi:ABC-2 type transport system ATP-binding protein
MSSPPAIQLDTLSKTFGRGSKAVQAVRDISLEVPRGQVFGFLGPNGAGKTTTIRLITDLIRPSSGRAFVFGQEVTRSASALKKVGALIEGAAFYPFMTGRANLETMALTSGLLDSGRIGALLEQVGLDKMPKRLLKDYSTGMKQRLGLAAALLTYPDLIILDEPTNGLDPAGMHEIRRFIRELADVHGKTVFLSSHLLHEVEQVCDQVAIINQGRIVRRGAVSELLSEGQSEIHIQASPRDQALHVLQQQWPAQLNPEAAEWITVSAAPADSHRMAEMLVQHGVQVHQIVRKRRTLEEFFLAATNGTQAVQENLDA